MGDSGPSMSYQRGGRWVLPVSQYALAFVKRAVLFAGACSLRKAGSLGRDRLTAPTTPEWLWQNLTKPLFRVLIWKGALEQETWRCPSHHHSQQGCREEQTSSSFLAILDSERPSQMLIVFVLTVFVLLYRFPVLWKERWPLLN